MRKHWVFVGSCVKRDIDEYIYLIYNIYIIYTIWHGGETVTTQLIVRIDEDIKKRLNRLARLEGKTTSEMVRELIEERIRERDIGAYVDDLWNRIGRKLKTKGAAPEEIKKAIKASRNKQG